MSSPVEHLTARAGATFGPRGWPLLDADGDPLRDPAGIRVQAQVRARPGSTEILHSWDSASDEPNASLVLLTDPRDTEPTVAVVLHATREETAAWSWRCCPYDVLVTAFGRTDEVVHGDFTVRRGVTG